MGRINRMDNLGIPNSGTNCLSAVSACWYNEAGINRGAELMTIALPPEMEERIRGEALRQGVAAETLIVKIISEHIPAEVPVENGSKSLHDLFAEWAEEDATDDPKELERRRQDTEELKAALNRNRLEMEGPNSRRPFP